MARRKLNANQLDLFAAPAPGTPAKPATLEPRGSNVAELPPGFSHERRSFGLSAIESERVLTLQSIAVTGYRYADGSSCCSACFPVVERAQAATGRGYRMTVYRAGLPTPLARCFACQVPFPGETAQEELDRRKQATS